MNNMNYYRWVVDNDLQSIYVLYSNPKEGVRLGAMKPGREHVPLSKPCPRKACDGMMNLTDSKSAVYKCEKCGKVLRPLYRWSSPYSPGNWLRFSTSKSVSNRASRIRSWYASLGVFDKDTVKQSSIFNWSFLTAYTLGIDIDIRSGLITDYRNRVELDKTIAYLKEVFSCCENSINLQTSGNGVYFMIHHSLCMDDIMQTAGKFRMLLKECAENVDEFTKHRIKIDDQLVHPSQVFKMAGSLHQTHELVAIPVDIDGKFVDMDLSQTDPIKFDMHNFVNDDGSLLWYNHSDKRESQDLYRMLDDINVEVEEVGEVTIYTRYRGDGRIERTHNTNYQRDNRVTDGYVYSVNSAASMVVRDARGKMIKPDKYDLAYIKRIEEHNLLI